MIILIQDVWGFVEVLDRANTPNRVWRSGFVMTPTRGLHLGLFFKGPRHRSWGVMHLWNAWRTNVRDLCRSVLSREAY